MQFQPLNKWQYHRNIVPHPYFHKCGFRSCWVFYLPTFLPSFIKDCQTQRKARVFFLPCIFYCHCSLQNTFLCFRKENRGPDTSSDSNSKCTRWVSQNLLDMWWHHYEEVWGQPLLRWPLQMTAQEEGGSKEDFTSLQGGDWFILVAVLMLAGFSKATWVPLASYYLAWPKQVICPL